MLLLGRSRSRRGLASALIGEIAAVIDGMEGFEEVRKLEDMETGAEEHLDELGAFTLPKFSVYESNTDRLDLFDAAIQRQIAYFFTRGKSCRAPACPCVDQKRFDGVVQASRNRRAKGNQRPFGTGRRLATRSAKTRIEERPRYNIKSLTAQHVRCRIVLVDACRWRWF